MDSERGPCSGVLRRVSAGLMTALALVVHSPASAAPPFTQGDTFLFELPPEGEHPGYPALSDRFMDSRERCARMNGCLENVYRLIEARLAERLAREFPHCWRTWSYGRTTTTPQGIVMVVTVRCLEYGREPT